MKREVLAPFPSVVIYGLLISLAHFKLLFCVFEIFFEKAFRFDFVMIHAGMYTKCLEMFCF